MTLSEPITEPRPVLLVVDDDPEVLRAVARDLRRRYAQDYRIVRAESGESALDALRELRERAEPVALLLSDQRMPGMDGVSFLAHAQELHPEARRALLTAYADTDAAIRAINQSRVHYYLTKPWDPPEEQLYPVVDELLDDWRAEWRPGYGGVRVVGDRWSKESHELRDFLARNGVPYTFHDVETDPEAATLLGRDPEQGHVPLPLVILPGGERLAAPDVTELAHRVGLSRPASRPFYELAIIGGGPAGLAAAVYGASEGLGTLLVEREAPGGQAGTSSRIENYLGFPAGLSGGDLARRAVTQAQKFGVEILTPRTVTALRVEGQYKLLDIEGEPSVSAHTVVLSTGVSWQKLPARDAPRFEGRGVYYGATRSEAPNCQDEDVFVVGAGNSAGQAALYFARYARRVVMLVRGATLEAKMSQYLVDQIHREDRVEVLLRHEVMACLGGTEDGARLEQIVVRDCATGEDHTFDTHNVFSFIGAVPHTDWLDGVVARDARGFVKVGEQLTREDLRDWPLDRPPFPLETSVPGVFAVGDVRATSVKRVASAVGEGSVTVSFVHQHLASL